MYKASGNTIYYYHADAQFNTQAITTIGKSPVVAATYVLSAYGIPESTTVSGPGGLGTLATNNAMIHQGLLYEPETGSYYNRWRQYLPMLGRFAQRDPAGYVDAINLLLYERNDSEVAADPYGLQPLVPPCVQFSIDCHQFCIHTFYEPGNPCTASAFRCLALMREAVVSRRAALCSSLVCTDAMLLIGFALMPIPLKSSPQVFHFDSLNEGMLVWPSGDENSVAYTMEFSQVVARGFEYYGSLIELAELAHCIAQCAHLLIRR